MTRRTLLILFTAALPVPAQDAAPARNFLVKLSVPIRSTRSKAGDPVRAAIISPETYLGGYLEGTVDQASTGPQGKLSVKFTVLQFKGKSTPVTSITTDFVNSKGHRGLDDEERPVRVENGAFLAEGADLWIDEGAELKLSVRQ